MERGHSLRCVLLQLIPIELRSKFPSFWGYLHPLWISVGTLQMEQSQCQTPHFFNLLELDFLKTVSLSYN